MKFIFASLLFTLTLPLFAETSELELIKLNEATFSEKELRTKPELCNFHRELQLKANVPAIECPRNEGSATKEASVLKQLNEAKSLAAIPNQSQPSLDEIIINMPQRRRLR